MTSSRFGFPFSNLRRERTCVVHYNWFHSLTRLIIYNYVANRTFKIEGDCNFLPVFNGTKCNEDIWDYGGVVPHILFVGTRDM
jgi:hypothetical protein